MLERTVYFSGPSGNGKTMLIRELLKEDSNYHAGNPEKLDRKEHIRNKRKKYLSYYDYVIAKINERFEHAKQHTTLEQKYPNLVILADRSIHDTVSYINAGLRRGWLNQEETKQLLNYQNKVHSLEYMPKHIVFLDYPIDVLMTYLRQRWETEGIGDRENEEFLGIDCNCFREHFSKLNDILHLTEKSDSNISTIVDWINRRIEK